MMLDETMFVSTRGGALETKHLVFGEGSAIWTCMLSLGCFLLEDQ